MTKLSDLLLKAAEKDREHYIEIIEGWKFFWMNQTQNSEEDHQNYFRRALGVDANMMYHLADELKRKNERLLKLIRAIAPVLDAAEAIPDWECPACSTDNAPAEVSCECPTIMRLRSEGEQKIIKAIAKAREELK